MKRPIRTVPAGVFKAKCLALLDDVSETGQEIVVTKRGRPVARVSAARPEAIKSLAKSVLCESDLVSPLRLRWRATS